MLAGFLEHDLWVSWETKRKGGGLTWTVTLLQRNMPAVESVMGEVTPAMSFFLSILSRTSVVARRSDLMRSTARIFSSGVSQLADSGRSVQVSAGRGRTVSEGLEDGALETEGCGRWGIQRTEGDQGQANGDNALNSCEYTVSKLNT